jgi:hypothetical protein
MNRNALWLLWGGFIVYIILFAPALHLDSTLKLLKNLITFQWAAINPVILSLFSLVGIWLLIFSSLLFFDGRMQSIRFYPFALASIASGTIGLIPYLALREPNQSFTGKKDAFLKVLDSRFFTVSLTITTLGLLGYALIFGDWNAFINEFISDKFINGMSIAFWLFYLVFPTQILDDDIGRRNWNSETMGQFYLFIALVPLFGPLVYLCLRPPMLESNTAVYT